MRKFIKKVSVFCKLQKNKWRDRKTHIYKACPFCHANIRLPKRSGTHPVRCPRCGERFDVTSK